MLLLVSLRGNIFLYYGEELGLTQVEVPFERLQDPEAIANWPLTLSRDGARTPMPWAADSPQLGFGDAEPWLPVGSDHAALAVDRQQADPDSLLALTRRLLAFRNAHDAMLLGTLTMIEAGGDLLVFERDHGGEKLLCMFNLGEASISWAPPQPDRWRIVECVNDASEWTLPAFAGLIATRIA